MCPPLFRLALVPLLMFAAGCSNISPIPSDIALGSTACQVREKMGQADRELRFQSVPKDARFSYVWQYRDTWYQSSTLPHRWGNWDLYFDDQCFYTAWRMAEPTPLESARMALQDNTARVTCPPAPVGGK